MPPCDMTGWSLVLFSRTLFSNISSFYATENKRDAHADINPVQTISRREIFQFLHVSS